VEPPSVRLNALSPPNGRRPSAVSADVAEETVKLDDTEIRERMSGNLCRCGAYVNIVTAITEAVQ
jgi:xanthine dehydrogenase YagT iron-sulfur-binding subunit